MTNLIAFILGLIIVGAVFVDYLYYGTEHIVFLAKKLTELIDWIAFWR